ncbi:DcrB-related protein [Pseudomonas plecoglossicida]|uniref:DcrB-related protein n=1 Tax=Pseudomonas plecoglossicida TaxID=70775 RepID=UPI003D2505CC
MEYELQEGGIALPPGFEDRTVNMFVLGASVPAPLSITISRDTLLPDETLQAYVERQIKMLTSKLRGYSRMGNKAVALSTTAPIPGIQIDAYYLNQGRPLYQRQAAFIVSPGRALIFSTTAQADFSAQQNQDWDNLLASFTPRNPVVANAEPGEQE